LSECPNLFQGVVAPIEINQRELFSISRHTTLFRVFEREIRVLDRIFTKFLEFSIFVILVWYVSNEVRLENGAVLFQGLLVVVFSVVVSSQVSSILEKDPVIRFQ
jgi:hypothetical protein